MYREELSHNSQDGNSKERYVLTDENETLFRLIFRDLAKMSFSMSAESSVLFPWIGLCKLCSFPCC